MNNLQDLPMHKVNETDLAPLEDAMNYTLADAMREGSEFTEQAIGAWIAGDSTCALSTAALVAKARHLI